MSKTYRIEDWGDGEHVIRLDGDWCGGWLADNHSPPSGNYDRCGIVNVPRSAVVFRSPAELDAAIAFVESKGYTLDAG